MRIEPVTGAVGAEVLGVDLAQDLADDTFASIRAAFLAHGVLFFRDQDLDVARHKAFASRFGKLFLHPNIQGSKTDPAVIDIVRNPGDVRIIGEDWHSDTPQVPQPPMGSVLYAVDVPPYGGDTLFASQYAAYDALSPGLKKMLGGVRALHSDRRVAGPARDLAQSNAQKKKSDDEWRETATWHPVVRTHPDTGRKALYVNKGFTRFIVGMHEAESREMLDFLFTHAINDDFIYRHKWRRHDLVVWDNRSLMHLATPYDPKYTRHMNRTTVAGDKPF